MLHGHRLPEKCPSDKLMMSIDKGDRSTSPVHLHVDDSTSVHVHVKKPRKPVSVINNKLEREGRMGDAKVKPTAESLGDSNLRRNTASARSRSKSPTRNGPWVPPPGRTSKGNKYAWQGPSHRLEITAAEPDTLHMSDLNTDDEDIVNNKMRNYERKIGSLMSEVGTLKGEVELQRSIRVIEKKDEILETSRRVLEEQEIELEDFKQELEATEIENRFLRKNVDQLRDEAFFTKSQQERLASQKDLLLNKLVEVEMDGQAAAKQVAALRDVIRRVREEKRMSANDSQMLNKQKELLMDRLNDFESTNRTLRRMLRERHEQEAEAMRMSEQRDLLLRKLSETEDAVQRYRTQALDKDRSLSDLRMQIDTQMEENVAISGLQTSLESTRGHLQKQLRQKEADCNRMAVQIRSLDSQLAQERIDVDHMRQLLAAAKEKSEKDKEALKKATRVQKQRAAKSEDAVEQINAQLLERETIMAEYRTDMDGLRLRCDKLTREKAQSHAENSGLKSRLAELEVLLEQLEDDSKVKIETANIKLQDTSAENSVLKHENDRMKGSISTIEDKQVQAEAEISQLRGSLRQYETLVDEYRSQMNRSRREADDTIVQLEDQKRETSRVRTDGESELDKVKYRLQNRLQELEPIPELLKTTELRLQDANDKLLAYERRNTETTKLIAELTSKVEHMNGQLDESREKWHSTRDENRSINAKVESLDRKMQDIDSQNRELLSTVAKREETMHQINMRLDEKTRECGSLARNLESALTEARRQSEQSRDKTLGKERATQSRILEVESQLSQSRAEIARVKREKEEAERKFNSRLYDLKDRLEQSHSTNRSMQNYVQFLKNSYANVFGDTSLAATSSPVRSTFH